MSGAGQIYCPAPDINLTAAGTKKHYSKFCQQNEKATG